MSNNQSGIAYHTPRGEIISLASELTKDDCQKQIMRAANNLHNDSSRVLTPARVEDLEREAQRVVAECRRWSLADCGE
jgi:RNase P/RNase MRP subunit POP5